MGSLELIIGPMFAGKSCELFRKIRILKVLNKSYIIIKPKIDTRDKCDMIVSHNSDMESCYNLSELKDIYNMLDIINIETIFIDEGQFFSDLKEIVLELVEKYNKNIIIAGLDGDFNRGIFGHILDLIPYSDKCIKLSAMCLKCKDGTPGIFSHRLATTNEQICIGASDKYISVCRKHYLELKN
jgi:thymidine kinase